LNTNLKKYGLPLLKIALTGCCLWYAFTKPNWAKMAGSWEKINLGWAMLALGSYTLSKVLASRRLNINFRLIGISLSEPANQRLYWLGMLYNLLLPGAITGDAYKVAALGKNPGISRKSLAVAVLLDRFSGLLSLLILIALLGCLVIDSQHWPLLLLLLAGALVPISYWTIRWLVPAQAAGFRATFLWGAGVQLLVLMTVFCLIQSIQLPDQATEYLLVFLCAAAMSVLPISVGGGLGIREFASIQGALWLHLSVESALLISLLFYGVTVITTLPGFFYIFKDPLSDSN
jgi:hypothetical protein